MLIYWIYAILSSFYSWLIYKLTESNIYGIIFYVISLLIIALYYVIFMIINLYIDLKYKKSLDQLECKLKRCKTIKKNNKNPDELCKNTFSCDDHYLCKRPDTNSRNCVIKGDCLELITKYINKININKSNELNNTMNTLNKIGIRKKTLDDYLFIYIYILSFIFLILLLYLYHLNKISIIFDLTFLDLDYIKQLLKS
jgi:hypothetical protein